MRSLRIAFVLSLALFAAGCGSRSVLQGGTSFTAPIQNPVGNKELYAVQSSYLGALTVMINYRRFCYSNPDRTKLPAICDRRRAIVLQFQEKDLVARRAITAAKNFVRNNPTISAVSAIGAAKDAVADFKAVATVNGVK